MAKQRDWTQDEQNSGTEKNWSKDLLLIRKFVRRMKGNERKKVNGQTAGQNSGQTEKRTWTDKSKDLLLIYKFAPEWRAVNVKE